MAALQPFHLAVPVHDLEAARAFYGNVLGCLEKRSGRRWIEYDLMGHQIVAHLTADAKKEVGPVTDPRHLPVPHFGVVLTMPQWHSLVARAREAGISFAMEPAIHAEGQADEQATVFLYDPSGNTFEFKAFADLDQLFGGA